MKANTPATREFTLVPECDAELPANEQSRFTFRPMTYAERLRSVDEMQIIELRPDNTRVLHDRSFQQAREILLACLVASENFPAGAPVAYPAKGTPAERDEWLAQLDPLDLYKLANAARERSAMDKLAGNS
jgi:hypothetical protein